MMGHTRAVPVPKITDAELLAEMRKSQPGLSAWPIDTVIACVGKRGLRRLERGGLVEIHPVAYKPLKALVYLTAAGAEPEHNP